MAFDKVARVEDVPPGQTRFLRVHGRPVILANQGGEIHALSGICPHQRKLLEEAPLWGYLLDCPWHHYTYDIRTGENHFPRNVYPGDKRDQVEGLRRYRVTVRAGDVWLDLEMTDLASKHCIPCRGGVPPLTGEPLRQLSAEVPGWKVVDEHHLERTYPFPDFKTALDFVVRIGEIAEQEGHHPDLYLSWGRVDVKTYTHKIDGLSESDFILAAKIDQLYTS